MVQIPNSSNSGVKHSFQGYYDGIRQSAKQSQTTTEPQSAKPTKPEQINQIQQIKASKVLDIEDSANPIIKKNQYKPDHFNTFNGAGESEKIINILLRYLRGEACNFDSVPTSTHIQNFSLT